MDSDAHVGIREKRLSRFGCIISRGVLKTSSVPHQALREASRILTCKFLISSGESTLDTQQNFVRLSTPAPNVAVVD